jgi:uncharacterized protein DUF4013
MDIGRSFAYVFEDPDWMKKVLIGAVVGIVPILGIAQTGYALEVTKRVYEGEARPLPEWDDIGGFFVRGLLVSLGGLIWSFPMVALAACVIGGVAVGTDSSSGAVAAAICLAVPLALLFFAFVLPIVGARYAVERHFGAMFEFGEIAREVRRSAVQLLILLAVALVASLIALLGVVACFIGVYFTVVYAGLIYAHALGLVYREARGLDSDLPAQATASF